MTISGDIGAEMRTYLLTQSGVSSVVSTRVYPDVLPIGYDPNVTGPAIIYAKISNVPTHYLGGHKDTERVRIQYDCYASTRSVANSLARAVQTAIEAKTNGTLTSCTISEMMIDGGITDHVEEPPDGSDHWRYIGSFDAVIQYY
jgi:hypothetical protein